MDTLKGCQKGQAGIEFMVILGVTLVIFILLGYIIYRNYVKSSDLKVYVYGAHMATHLADNINTLNAVGWGYETKIIMPEKLYGDRNYTISFFENESSVFLRGSSFAKGHELTFSAPLSMSNIHCLLPQCKGSCNESSVEECLDVNETMTIRVVRYVDGIYLTPEHQIRQGNIRGFVAAYVGEDEVNADSHEGLLRAAGDKWNAMYVYRNLVNETVSLVFKVNLSNSERLRLDFTELIGDVVDVKSNDTGPPELDLDSEPEARWMGTGGSYDIDGGAVRFEGGFSICIDPNQMPAEEWMLLSSDGNHIILDKTETICITYP